MIKRAYFKLIASLIFLSFSTVAWSVPQLNGVAVRNEFGAEQFIGAVYADSLSSDADSLIFADENKRMEVRVLAEKISPRQFKRMWIEGMAINSDQYSLQSQAENTAKFSNMLKVKLARGDHFVIDRQAGKGVVISVNGVTLGRVDDVTFFDILLQTWVGQVPLSSEFKKGVLKGGGVDGSLVSKFESVQPDPQRVTALQAALGSRGSAEKARQAKLEAEARERAAADAEAKARAAAVAAAQAAAAAEDERNKLKTDKARAEAEARRKEAQRRADEAQKIQAERAAARAREAQILAQARAEWEQELALSQDLLITEDDIELTAEALLIRQRYIGTLMKWSYRYIEYPERAVRRGQEGSVLLSVTLDRLGNVKGVRTVEETKFKELNNEAVEAVKKATPYPPVPGEIVGQDFTFSVPIVFKLD